MALFRLLHASDLHLGRGGFTSLIAKAGWSHRLQNGWPLISHNPSAVGAFARFAFANRHSFDALVITGDLATTGNAWDLRAAYRLCSAAPAHQGVYLTSAGEPTLSHWARAGHLDILPGNHDRYRSRANLCRPGGVTFDAIFNPPQGRVFWSAGQGVAPGIAIRRGNAVVHVVKADFALHRGDNGRRHYWLPGWLGQGRVYRAVLDRLVATTDQIRIQIRQSGWIPITLWAIHFDPSSTDATLQLLDWKLFADAADAVPVGAVLCGHTHETKIKPLSPSTTAFACGTTAQAALAHGVPGVWDCQIIEVDASEDDGSLKAIRAEWYRCDRGQFRLIGTR